jgi:hypothetical protein
MFSVNIFIVIVIVVVAVFLTFAGTKFWDRLRRRDAETEAQEIIRKAKQEVDSRRREAELEIKEAALAAQTESWLDRDNM